MHAVHEYAETGGRITGAGLGEQHVRVAYSRYDTEARERAMQGLRTHGALVILLLSPAVIALRLLWPPLDCWLVRLLVIFLFTDHLPEMLTDCPCDPARALDILQEPPMERFRPLRNPR